MARVCKQKYSTRGGEHHESPTWYIEFTDHKNVLRRLPASTGKAAAQEMLRNVVRLVAYHVSSGGQVDPTLMPFLEALPPATRNSLVKIGLLSGQQAASGKPLSEHLDDFATALGAKGNTKAHVVLQTARIRNVFTACGFTFYSDLNGAAVANALQTMRADTILLPVVKAQNTIF